MSMVEFSQALCGSYSALVTANLLLFPLADALPMSILLPISKPHGKGAREKGGNDDHFGATTEHWQDSNIQGR